jgi:hypothetical protein
MISCGLPFPFARLSTRWVREPSQSEVSRAFQRRPNAELWNVNHQTVQFVATFVGVNVGTRVQLLVVNEGRTVSADL